MSLAEELQSEKAKGKPRSQTDQWLEQWRPTLGRADQAALDAALADPAQSPTQLHRVLKRHGCPVGISGFMKWVKAHREVGSFTTGR